METIGSLTFEQHKRWIYNDLIVIESREHRFSGTSSEVQHVNNRQVCRLYEELRRTMEKTSRVDVSETFSAYQLRFRNFSLLFQHCSLPENLWNSADSDMNSAEFWRIHNGNFWFIFHFFLKMFWSTSISWHIILLN